DKRFEQYRLRAEAVENHLDISSIATALADINGQIASSSGYLGEISDRSKKLFFNRQTVGQYLYEQVKKNPHARLKKQVFYRQDYLDEFEKIWQTQSQFYPELTEVHKSVVRDIIIFYQRKLKSQKHLVSYCEFETQQKTILKDGKKIIIKEGRKVVPKSSPLFQEFRILQTVNHLSFVNKETGELWSLTEHPEERQRLIDKLNFSDKLTEKQIMAITGLPSKNWQLIHGEEIIGNRTNNKMIAAFIKILQMKGIEKNWDKMSPAEILNTIKNEFKKIGIDTRILTFDSSLTGKAMEKQPAYQLWHLLYAAEDDTTSPEELDGEFGTQYVQLRKKLSQKFGFKPEHSKLISGIVFERDYGNLSAKAISKILPGLKKGMAYSDACKEAGYKHSGQLTREENQNRPLEDKLEIIPKNTLRNPVVEKILNQMVNVVNMIIDHPEMGKPDEIRIEMARDLKKSAKERVKMTQEIAANTRRNQAIIKILQKEFDIQRPTRNDIIRYKLWEELKP
ncbi:MAG: type II CRISPR RNA-guided endonuclease Cas9, partial [Cyclobacteriaceae bacterium]